MKLVANRDARDLREAKERAARAQVYAKLFPEFIRPADLQFQKVEFQLSQVRSFNVPNAPQKV